jgi:hypothetical protein
MESRLGRKNGECLVALLVVDLIWPLVRCLSLSAQVVLPSSLSEDRIGHPAHQTRAGKAVGMARLAGDPVVVLKVRAAGFPVGCA